MKKGFMSMIIYVSLLFMTIGIAAPSIIYASGDNSSADSDAEEQVNDHTDNTYRDEQSEIVEDPSNLYVSARWCRGRLQVYYDLINSQTPINKEIQRKIQ